MPNAKRGSFSSAVPADADVGKREYAGQRWGDALTDDAAYIGEDLHALDDHDPNFDDIQDQKVLMGNFVPPTPSAVKRVVHSSEVKATVQDLVHRFLVSYDTDAFTTQLEEINNVSWTYEIPKIIISISLDCTEEQRAALCDLLRHLVNHGSVTRRHVEIAFGRLLNRLDDLSLDVPNAGELFREFLRRAVANGYCDSDAAELMRQGSLLRENPEEVARVRPLIAKMVDAYLGSEDDVEEADLAIQKIGAPQFGHEIVKKLIYAATDKSDRDCESACKLLVHLSTTGTVCPLEIEKGFQQILDLIDDVITDIPGIVDHVACFVARAVNDEVLPPAFLTRTRMDLNFHDLGIQVIDLAEALLNLHAPGLYLCSIWDEKNAPEVQAAMGEIIDEFLAAESSEEARRLLKAPHIGPRFIKRLFTVALDRDRAAIQSFIDLLSSPASDYDRCNIRKGLDLIRSCIADLKVDVPNAPELLDHVTASLKHVIS
ncbi:MI domain-containing protein [Plasmodiophora brassicae]